MQALRRNRPAPPMERPRRLPRRMVAQAPGTMAELTEEAQAMARSGNRRRRKPIALAIVTLALAGVAGVAIVQLIRRRRRQRMDDSSLEAELERIRDDQRQLEQELNARARRSVNVSA